MKRISLIALILTMNLQAQDLRDKIGQMIMVGFDHRNALKDTVLADISERNLGGALLFGYNIEDPEQVRNLTDELQSYAGTPLFIATDQEGGYVARLNAYNGFDDSYSAYQLGTVFDSEDSTRAMVSLMAGWLAQSGINVNLAPVADVNINPDSPAIGRKERSFSENPVTVTRHTGWFIEECNKQGIINTLKHFPGHGSAIGDSHYGFTDITGTWSDVELIPYQSLIGDGYNQFVMTGHLYNAHLDSLYPASLSEAVVNGILRDSLEFSGVVISDEMSMGAITSMYGFDEALVQAIHAGTDILLYRTNVYEDRSLVRRVIDTIEEQVMEGNITGERIDASYARIMTLKQAIGTRIAAGGGDPVPAHVDLFIYPNPFNAITKISVNARENTVSSLTIFNILGQTVYSYGRVELKAGRNEFAFDANRLPGGIYFVDLRNEAFRLSRKITLLR